MTRMLSNHGFTRISYTNPIFILVKHIRVNPSNPRHPRSIIITTILIIPNCFQIQVINLYYN